MSEAIVPTPAAPAATPSTSIVVQNMPKTGMKGGPGSADALLDAYDEVDNAETNIIENAADKAVKVNEVAAKKAAAKEVVKSLESKGDGEDSEESGADGAKETVPGDGDSGDTAQEIVEAFINGEKVDIPRKAEFEIEVDGKMTKVSLEEAIQARVGQDKFNRSIEQRLSYANQRELRVDNKVSNILNKAQEVVEVAKTGDPLPALRALARMVAAGNEVEAVEIERQFLEKMETVTNVWTRMNPEQRKAYFAEQRAKAAEEKASRLENDVVTTNNVRQAHVEVQNICKEIGLEVGEFQSLYHEFIIPNLVGPGKEFESVEQIGPREVAQVHIKYSSLQKVNEAAAEVSPELSKDSEFMEELFRQAVQNPSWQKEDIKYIIAQITNTPSKSVQNLNRKVERAKTQRLNSSLKQGSAARKGENVDEAEYEAWFGNASKQAWAGKIK
jgi:hypothetical protein